MPVVLYKEVNRSNLLQYTRPDNASYETKLGSTITVGPDTPRIEYKDGVAYGLKFGDGDSATIVHTYENEWPSNGQARTLVVEYNAPGGIPFIQSGDLDLRGYGMMKTLIIDIPANFELEDKIEIAPNAENYDGEHEAHLLALKLYVEDIDFSPYPEHEVMVGLNEAAHGEWTITADPPLQYTYESSLQTEFGVANSESAPSNVQVEFMSSNPTNVQVEYDETL